MCACQVASECPTLCDPTLQPARLLGPWDSPDKNTAVSCCALFQGMFLTQDQTRIAYVYLHWQVGSLRQLVSKL